MRHIKLNNIVYNTFFLAMALIIANLILTGCSNTASDDNTGTDSLTTLITPPNSLTVDSLKGERINQDYFNNRLAIVDDSLQAWGFSIKADTVLNSAKQFNSHWWLKVFTRHSRLMSRKERYPSLIIPDSLDYVSVSQIRQVSYKKTWEYVIEEWSFTDGKGADRWLEIAINAKPLDDFKPPRVFWVRNHKLYFIMSTAARDWTLHSKEIIKMVNGNTRWLIELMNEPINLSQFLKKSGAREGKEEKVLDYYYHPDSEGVYMNYKEFDTYNYDSLENRVVLTTFRMADNETLIAIRGALKHRTLGNLSIIGQTKVEIEDWFGNDYHQQGSSILYSQNHSFLMITFQNDKAVWFDYFNANDNINSISDLPGYTATISQQ